ncbi:MAG: efflux RND transporter periplasmic adaptor subunit [Acidobacteria bacterium]|nr:MAG: efflux RND transporter periplasmic adaptor subunit [Acidobacteriota bacterium]
MTEEEQILETSDESDIKQTPNPKSIVGPKEKIRSRLPQLIGGLFLLGLLFLTWRLFGDRSNQAATKPREEVVPVETAVASQKDVPIEIRSIGNVEAVSTIAVRSQVEGVLEKVYFTPGQEVKTGQLLFTIDQRPLQAALSQAQANVMKATAAVRQGQDIVAKDEATARNLRTIAKRDNVLVEEGIISREEYDTAVSAADAADATVRSDQSNVTDLQAAVKAEQATVENAKVQLSYTTIKAPVSGKTGNLAVTAGNLVRSNDTTPLVTITSEAPIYATFSVPESELPRIKRNSASNEFKTEALIPGDESQPALGELSLVDNSVDVTTGTIRLKATFANTDRRLYPGQFVNIVLTLGIQHQATVVPSSALQIGQDHTFVYVVKPDATVEVRNVKAGGPTGELTVIEDGLRPGEQVVTDGQLRLVPGAKVQAKSRSA